MVAPVIPKLVLIFLYYKAVTVWILEIAKASEILLK